MTYYLKSKILKIIHLILLIISLKLKKKITGTLENNSQKYVEIMVPLKYLSTFRRMPSINCEINLNPSWSEECLIVATAVINQVTTFLVINRKLNV